MDHNELTGDVPSELRQLSRLRWLSLDHNRLTGEILSELGELSQLQWLSLDRNQLTGEIPAELGQLSRLWALHLQHNPLTEAIPVELGNLSQLQPFSYGGNLLTGSVPLGLSYLPEVYVLNIAATRTDETRMKVTWDDPVDPTVSYEYRLRDAAGNWTEWVVIEDPQPMSMVGEMVTIEWTLAGLPSDVHYTYISVRPSNRNGVGPAMSALVRPIETASDNGVSN